ncbi:MAG: hypothetical protein CMM60_06430 [Rhodospirillaceae bacterium]|jgi:hypothetical protein|nr:hypothetical protein [Rhodospirillaceae bacterium]
MSKKWLALTLKFLVSGFLIWFLFSNIDLGQAMARAAQADPKMLLAAVLVLFVQIGVGGARWGVVMNAIGAPLGFVRSAQLFYIGAFFNQTLPSSVGGDAVRVYKVYRQGLGLRSAFDGVILERVVTVVALVALVGVTLPWFLPRLDETARSMAGPGFGVVALGAAAGLWLLMTLDRLPETLRRWRLVRGLGNLGVDARRVFLRLRHLIPVLAWGLVTHVNISFCVFLLGLGLGLEITLIDSMVLVPTVLLIMTLPISIAGWGVRETAMVGLFGLIGVPGEGALVLSVLFGLVGIAVALPGGALWLASRDRGETMEYQTPDIENGNGATARSGGGEQDQTRQ